MSFGLVIGVRHQRIKNPCLSTRAFLSAVFDRLGLQHAAGLLDAVGHRVLYFDKRARRDFLWQRGQSAIGNELSREDPTGSVRPNANRT